MHRTFIAAVVATSMAIAGVSALPARADPDDLAKVIARAIASAIDDNDDRDRIRPAAHDDYNYKKKRKRHHKYKHHHKKYRNPGYADTHHEYEGWNHIRHPRLPEACRIYRQTYHGTRYGYSGRCLQRQYHGYHAMPHQCAVYVGGKYREIYRDQCLRKFGYYTDGR